MQLQPCSKLDYETPLYQGCGATELLIISILAAGFCFPISIITGVMVLDGIHAVFLVFAVLVLTTLFVITCVTSIYKKLRRGKPEGWLMRATVCYLPEFHSTQLIFRSGCGSTSRDEQ